MTKISKKINIRANQSLEKYLQEIGEVELLNPEAEIELARRIRQNDQTALEKLTKANLRFVVSVAKQYQNQGLSLGDLINEGNLGLIKAAKRFDETRGFKFISYAVWWIRQALLHSLSDQGRIISVPPKLSGPASRLGRHLAALATQLDRTPTTQELADDLEISEADAAALLQISGHDLSLNDPLETDRSESRRQVGDVLEQVLVPKADEELVHRAVRQELRRAIAGLDPREREVMRLRFGLDGGDALTLQQVGDRMKLSRERVRQLQARAKERLRRSTRLQGVKSALN